MLTPGSEDPDKQKLDIANKLNNCWLDFTSTTSFKSKANCKPNEYHERHVFLYLEMFTVIQPKQPKLLFQV